MSVHHPFVIFKTSEGEVMSIKTEHALISDIVSTELAARESEIPPLVFQFPAQVGYDALKRLEMYMTHHRGIIGSPSSWDFTFISKCATDSVIYGVLAGANFIHMSSLVHLCLKHIAVCIRNKTLYESMGILESLKSKRMHRSIAMDPVALNSILINSGIPNEMSDVLVGFATKFILQFDMHSLDLNLQLPFYDGHDVYVDWGDNNIDHFDGKAASHRYDASGKYKVSISGDMSGFGFGNEPDEKNGSIVHAPKLIDILQWGCARLGNRGDHFSGCINLTRISAEDIPDLSGITNLSGMFEQARKFEVGGLHKWDVSQVTNMSNMFGNAVSFRDDISNWDVGNVTDMASMFARAYSFKSDLSSWNVSKVSDMHWMFAEARMFSSDLSSWDVGNVRDMSLMFYYAHEFESDLSKWNVGKLKTADSMFASAMSFNSDLSKWNVSRIIDMGWMFARAYSFNSDLSKWDVSHVKDMSHMFLDAQLFKSDISSWNVGQVENMYAMFSGATMFGCDLSSWNVENVITMTRMFNETSKFNSDISDWNLTRVTDVSGMFYNAASFSWNLSKWNIYRLPNTRGMFHGTRWANISQHEQHQTIHDLYQSDSELSDDTE
jgi:surface protein